MRKLLTNIIAPVSAFVAWYKGSMFADQTGATVTSDFLAGLMTNYRAIWQKALDEFEKLINQYQMISTEFLSTTDKETYGWMGSPPAMREWTDVRVYRALKAYDYTLTNKHYEGTIEVDRDTYEDDKYGMIAPRVKGLARRALKHYNKLVFSALDDGVATDAYDSIYFFKTVRTIGKSGNISNILDGSYSASASEIRDALGAAVVRMASFKDDQGEPIGLIPDLIVCSPTMYIPIQNALLPGVAGTVRPEAGMFPTARIMQSAQIDRDALDWYVLCTDVEVNPIIFQMRKRPEFVSLDDPKGEHVFKNKTFLYGVDDRFAVGYGDPRTAIRITDNS